MTSDDDPARPATDDVGLPAVYRDTPAGSSKGTGPGWSPVTAATPGIAPDTAPAVRPAATEGMTRDKDGRSWAIGTDGDVAWIVQRTVIGLTITSAIPPDFEAYATVVVPELRAGMDEHEQRVVRLLTEHSSDHDWWLGYLDTGASDIVFPDAPRVRLYSDWPYVLVKGGPEQALRWRARPSPLHCGLPDLMFPTDHSWLISALWDDEWWCLGGSAELVGAFLHESGLEAHRLDPDGDATPPGHVAR